MKVLKKIAGFRYTYARKEDLITVFLWNTDDTLAGRYTFPKTIPLKNVVSFIQSNVKGN